MADASNLSAEIPARLPEEVVETLARAGRVRVERIVSQGHPSPDGFWYDQEENELVVLIAGAARLVFDGEAAPMEMRPGSFVNIPAYRRHRVEWTEPGQLTIWLAVFY